MMYSNDLLNPNNRTLYTSILTPPTGMVLDEAIATTYSLDLVTLLEAQVNLALLANEDKEDSICMIESIRQISDRLTVFVQNGCIRYPKVAESNPKLKLLLGVLDDMTIGVSAPKGGVFHPKIWAIRFKTLNSPTTAENTQYRLVVLSRNISNDRSWDLSLQLEGKPTRIKYKMNEPLEQLFKSLPNWKKQGADPERIKRTKKFAKDLRRVKWEKPVGFDELYFYLSGMNNFEWEPEESKNLAVISPFCTDNALNSLVEQTDHAEILIFKARNSPIIRRKYSGTIFKL